MTRILVVEDEPGIALGLEDTLRLEGHDVEIVADGVTASERVRQETFDLIVLDVMLPGKNGFDVCRDLRRIDEKTPVILLTARAVEDDRVLGLDAGANDYVTKPFSPRELAARIRGLLRYVETSRGGHERLEREFQKARDVQQRLFPGSRPVVLGLDYSCVCRPAVCVSGDYYDYASLPSGHFAFLVADVSGKGMPAALLGASLHGTARAAAFEGLGCGQVLARANASLFDEMSCERYVTVFFGIYDAHARRLTYANAGHYPPFLVRGGTHTRLPALTPPVGMFGDLPPVEGMVDLQAGDWLVVASDGIPEAFDSNSEEFGDGRVLSLLEEHRSDTAAQLCNRVVDAAAAFAGMQPTDDMTVFAARVLTEF
jgi:serine phosphatase RsbU (regulator of sigma subunit)